MRSLTTSDLQIFVEERYGPRQDDDEGDEVRDVDTALTIALHGLYKND